MAASAKGNPLNHQKLAPLVPKLLASHRLQTNATSGTEKNITHISARASANNSLECPSEVSLPLCRFARASQEVRDVEVIGLKAARFGIVVGLKVP